MSVEILRTVDKLRKIGKEEVQKLLHELTGEGEKANAILQYISKEDEKEPFLTTLDRLTALAGGENPHSERMRTIYSYLHEAGIEEHFTFDPDHTAVSYTHLTLPTKRIV